MVADLGVLKTSVFTNLQRYIGKRKAMDSFWAGIKRNMIHDLKSALTIARLHCMELLGLGTVNGILK